MGVDRVNDHPPKKAVLVCKPCDLLWVPTPPGRGYPLVPNGRPPGGRRPAPRVVPSAVLARFLRRSKAICAPLRPAMGFYTLLPLAGRVWASRCLTVATVVVAPASLGRGFWSRRPAWRCRSNGRPCNCPRDGRRMGPRPCLPGRSRLPRNSLGGAACAPFWGPRSSRANNQWASRKSRKRRPSPLCGRVPCAVRPRSGCVGSALSPSPSPPQMKAPRANYPGARALRDCISTKRGPCVAMKRRAIV